MNKMDETVLLDIPNCRNHAPGIHTGGKPHPKDLEKAKELGVRRVINLCPPGEISEYDEPSTVAQLGMEYINIPIAGAQDLNRTNAQNLADALHGAGADHPVLVHCASSNRVGALFALKAHYCDGLDVETALEVGRRTGLTGLEPTVRQLL